jgi:hypothetical protein
MNRIALLLFTLLLAGGCAARDPSQVEACQNRVNSVYPSSTPGVRVQRAEGFRNCARSTGTSNAFTEEYHAYWIYLATEVEAGRMSDAQGRYLLAQKESQIQSQLMGAAAQYQALQPQQPAYRPVVPQQRSPVYTNCTRDPWGNVNCVTQ